VDWAAARQACETDRGLLIDFENGMTRIVNAADIEAANQANPVFPKGTSRAQIEAQLEGRRPYTGTRTSDFTDLSSRYRAILVLRDRMQRQYDNCVRTAALNQLTRQGVRPIIGGNRSFYVAPMPTPGGHVPWPIEPVDLRTAALGFAAPSGSAGGGFDHFVEGEIPINMWSRFEGQILSGTFGRNGLAGTLQAGIVVGVSETVDVGIFGQLSAARAGSTLLDADVTNRAVGLGGYVTFRGENDLHLGLMAMHEWGGNDIRIGTGTGSFGSGNWTISLDGAIPLYSDGLVITGVTVASLSGWSNGAYVDSNGLAVPATSGNQTNLSAMLDFSYPMAGAGIGGGMVTPSLTAGTTYTAGSLGVAELSFNLGAGLSFEIPDGGTFNASARAGGLGGSVQTYGVRASLTMPLP